MTVAGAPAAAGQTTAHTYFGKYPGLVVDRVPPSDAGHHRGELLVRVPGILEEDAGGGQRPLEAVAKPCFMPGLFWVPEVGDTVWVEFAAGDVNSPIWTGVWYAADATPATVDGDRPTADQKVLRTPTGQVVQLDDTAGAEQLALADEANGNRATLDAAGVAFRDGSGNAIRMESGGIKLEAGACSIELGASTIRITNGVHTLEMGGSATTLDHLGLGAQALVLAPVVDWLLTHQHIGNMGAPTPLFPLDLGMLQVPVPPKKSGP